MMVHITAIYPFKIVVLILLSLFSFVDVPSSDNLHYEMLSISSILCVCFACKTVDSKVKEWIRFFSRECLVGLFSEKTQAEERLEMNDDPWKMKKCSPVCLFHVFVTHFYKALCQQIKGYSNIMIAPPRIVKILYNFEQKISPEILSSM